MSFCWAQPGYSILMNILAAVRTGDLFVLFPSSNAITLSKKKSRMIVKSNFFREVRELAFVPCQHQKTH